MKFNKLLITTIALFVLCFAIALTYISLLGENNRVDTSINRFLDQITSQSYFSICNNTVFMGTDDPYQNESDCADNSFLLELSLIKFFKLNSPSNYKVLIKKDHFWIPFLGNNSIKASLSLINPEDYKHFQIFGEKPDPIYLENLFTVNRQNGTWKIVKINLKHQDLSPIFKELNKNLDLSSYITKTGDKYIIKKMVVDTKNLDYIEKRKFEYISLKIKQIIMDEDNNKEES